MRRLLALVLTGVAVTAFAGEKEDLAAKMLDQVQMKENLEQMSERVAKMQTDMFNQMNLNDEEKKRASEFQQKIMDKMWEAMAWEEIKDDYIKLFAETYTVDELRAIIEFNETPAGKSLIEKQPEIMQKSMAIAQRRILQALPAIRSMAEEMQKELRQ